MSSSTKKAMAPAAGLSSSKVNRSITYREGSPLAMNQGSPDRSNSRLNGTNSPSPNCRFDFLTGGVTTGGWADWRKDASASKQHQYQTITADNLRASKLDGSPSPTRNRVTGSVISASEAVSVSPSRAASRTNQNPVVNSAHLSQTTSKLTAVCSSPDPRLEAKLRENAMWSFSG